MGVPVADRITVDIALPEKWKVKHFWAVRQWRAFGVVLAFSPRVFCLGVELIAGTAKGIALCIGPFCLGGATIRLARTDNGEG